MKYATPFRIRFVSAIICLCVLSGILLAERLTDSITAHNPTDVVLFQGRAVATELFNNRLFVYADESHPDAFPVDCTSDGFTLSGPHYLSVSPWGSLLVTDGWGGKIHSLSNLAGRDWQSFSGRDRLFNAPHGICTDTNGWIYVADSLNSQLVRFRDMKGAGWQVFPDISKKVGYGRQIAHYNGALWVSNSYENRPGLNAGHGSNILKISDFESGLAEELIAFPDTNMTALMPLDEFHILIGLWGPYQVFAMIDLQTHHVCLMPPTGQGIPYGLYRDPRTGEIIGVSMGVIEDRGRRNTGGLSLFQEDRFVPISPCKSSGLQALRKIGSDARNIFCR